MSTSHLDRAQPDVSHAGRGNLQLLGSSESASSVPPAGAAFACSGGSPPAAIETAGAAAPGPEGAGHGAGHGARQARTKAARRPRTLDPESSVAPVLLTIAQAAQRLAVSHWTVREWISSGRLKVVRLPGDGRLVRVELAALDALVAACRE